MGFTEQEFELMLQNQRIANGLPASDAQKTATRSEAELERICTQMLEHDGWRPLKTDPVSRRSQGKGFGEVGMADYLYMRAKPWPKERFIGQQKPGDNPWIPVVMCQAEILWIEWKRPGGVNAEHQKAWQAAERAKGFLVWVAGEDFEATADAFWVFYSKSGLKR